MERLNAEIEQMKGHIADLGQKNEELKNDNLKMREAQRDLEEVEKVVNEANRIKELYEAEVKEKELVNVMRFRWFWCDYRV